jgi:hypothetical protein
MNLTGEVKLNVGIVANFCVEEPFALGQVHQMTILVFCNIGLFVSGEIF